LRWDLFDDEERFARLDETELASRFLFDGRRLFPEPTSLLADRCVGAAGVRANTVSPGNTYFPGGVWQQIEQGNPQLFKDALALNPTGRMGTPQEMANGAVFLASPAASFVTGTNLVVDGALTRGVQF